MPEGKVIVSGIKPICYVMDYLPTSWRSCKKRLKKHKLLYYYENKPYVVLSEVEAYLKRK